MYVMCKYDCVNLNSIHLLSKVAPWPQLTERPGDVAEVGGATQGAAGVMEDLHREVSPECFSGRGSAINLLNTSFWIKVVDISNR